MQMTNLHFRVDSPAEILRAAERLRQTVSEVELTPEAVIGVLECWANHLGGREFDDLPGIVFLRMWLRRGTLEPIIARELGAEALEGGWNPDGRALCRAFPVGVVAHWPAGNVEIQPLLSMTCSLLGGNAALVRIPSDLVELMQPLMEALVESDPEQVLTPRIFVAAFEHGRRDLHEAMARSADGAMIWGGEEAVLQLRSLPFPHWTRLAIFGPRISVAAMDAATWVNSAGQQTWCRRIARDVWQFDQQACSSPQVLFLERAESQSTEEFLASLRRAFEEENRLHPRRSIPASLTSAISQARAAWLLNDASHQAYFPAEPDWTILVGAASEIPQPTQGRTLTVLQVDNLAEPVAKFDGNVQTLGLGMADAAKERELAQLAGNRGVDRIVKLGHMHVFVPPWDGMDLIRPMVRIVRHIPSAE
jgi:hypothetical protein